MRHLLFACLLVLLAFVPFGLAAPVEGPRYYQDRRVEVMGKIQLIHDFIGGERACVIAIGDHKPVVPIKITVYDDKENVIAEDLGTDASVAGRPGTADYVAVIWYPPRDMSCRIVIESQGVEYNEIDIAVK